MPTTAIKESPIYLREARLSAGYANRDTASTGVPFSPETIGRHERGEVPLLPDDAVIYAKCYKRDDILMRYCVGCPIGQRLQQDIEERDFMLAAMRLNNRLEKAPNIIKMITSVADDGRVDDNDRKIFITAMREGEEIIVAFKELKLWAFSARIATPEEIRKAAPEPPRNG